MLSSADTFVEVEVGTFEGFVPDARTLAAIAVPMQLLISDDGRRPWHQAAGRLAERLGVGLKRTPGTHAPYHDHPHELARTMQAFLRRHSEVVG